MASETKAPSLKEPKDLVESNEENQDEYEDEVFSYANGKSLGLSLRLGYNQSAYIGIGLRHHFNDNTYIKLTFDYGSTTEDTGYFSASFNPIEEKIQYYHDSLIIMTQIADGFFVGGGLQILSLRGNLLIDGSEIDPDILKRAFGISGNVEYLFEITESFAFSIYGDLSYYLNAPEIGYVDILAFDQNDTQLESSLTDQETILDSTSINIGISVVFIF